MQKNGYLKDGRKGKVLKQNYKYIITTGWWCTNDDDVDSREHIRGDSYIRTDEFHKIWFDAVDRYTNPEKIFIVDSDSPVKPMIDEEKELLMPLMDNAGHSTNHTGKLCGVSRAHLLGMSLAMVNEADYWVYIEQDALIYGENIIENCIKEMKKPYMFGYGLGTPQPVQQSLMIIKREAIPQFINNFNKIKAKDSEISPEVKFAIASSAILMSIPERVYIKMEENTKLGNLLKRIVWKLIKTFRGFDYVPVGYGRVRPIDFSDKHFYFQHGSEEELKKWVALHDNEQK